MERLKFSIGDHVFIKVLSMKGVIRFRKIATSAPRFVGPFPIVERIGKVAYRVELPNSLVRVHNFFHISHIRKCIRDLETTIAPIV